MSSVYAQLSGFILFFFQAEDGIRYLVRSRGLGDVYKRQVFNDTKVVNARLFGEKNTGGKVELLVERVLTGNLSLIHI